MLISFFPRLTLAVHGMPSAGLATLSLTREREKKAAKKEFSSKGSHGALLSFSFITMMMMMTIIPSPFC